MHNFTDKALQFRVDKHRLNASSAIDTLISEIAELDRANFLLRGIIQELTAENESLRAGIEQAGKENSDLGEKIKELHDQ